MLTLKVFLSSPGDVAEERRLAVETVRALADDDARRRLALRVQHTEQESGDVPLKPGPAS